MDTTALWAIVSAILSVLLSIPIGILVGRKYKRRVLNRDVEMAENILASLERLSELHRCGELTDDEWEEQKRMLLYWPFYLNTRTRLIGVSRAVVDKHNLLDFEMLVLVDDGSKIDELDKRRDG